MERVCCLVSSIDRTTMTVLHPKAGADSALRDHAGRVCNVVAGIGPAGHQDMHSAQFVSHGVTYTASAVLLLPLLR